MQDSKHYSPQANDSLDTFFVGILEKLQINLSLNCLHSEASLRARFMRPTWGPSGADRTQVCPMLAPWTLLSGLWRAVFSGNRPALSQNISSEYWLMFYKRNETFIDINSKPPKLPLNFIFLGATMYVICHQGISYKCKNVKRPPTIRNWLDPIPCGWPNKIRR